MYSKKETDSQRVSNSPFKRITLWASSNLARFQTWSDYDLLLLLECSPLERSKIEHLYYSRKR